MQDRWKEWYQSGTEEIEEHALLALVRGAGVTIHSEEHDDWRWTTFDEALGLLEWPENVHALACCHRALSDQVRSS